MLIGKEMSYVKFFWRRSWQLNEVPYNDISFTSVVCLGDNIPNICLTEFLCYSDALRASETYSVKHFSWLQERGWKYSTTILLHEVSFLYQGNRWRSVEIMAYQHKPSMLPQPLASAVKTKLWFVREILHYYFYFVLWNRLDIWV